MEDRLALSVVEDHPSDHPLEDRLALSVMDDTPRQAVSLVEDHLDLKAEGHGLDLVLQADADFNLDLN